VLINAFFQVKLTLPHSELIIALKVIITSLIIFTQQNMAPIAKLI